MHPSGQNTSRGRTAPKGAVIYFGRFIVRSDPSRAGYLGEATATAHCQVMVNRGGRVGCGTYLGCETYKGRSAKIIREAQAWPDKYGSPGSQGMLRETPPAVPAGLSLNE